MMSSLWMKDVAGVEGLCISSKLFATLMSLKFVVCIDSDCVENVIRLVGLGVYGGGPVMLTIPHRGGEVRIDEGKRLLELDRQGADGGFGQIRQDRAGGCVDAGVPSVERRRRRRRRGGSRCVLLGREGREGQGVRVGRGRGEGAMGRVGEAFGGEIRIMM
jgi:hypothetical protein